MLISERRQTGQTTVISAITDVLIAQELKVLIVQLGLSGRVKSECQVTVKGADNKPARDPGDYKAKDAEDQRCDTALIKGPSGKIHAALSELLRSRGRMYNVVLIDCLDLKHFPEALSIVSLVDDVLPVVMAGHSKVDPVLDTIDQFRDVQAAIPGIVLTKLRHNRSSWAFCWMSKMRLDSARQIDRQTTEHAV
jgi:molybdopterin-guanine dinucleotide biosynthesis protein